MNSEFRRSIDEIYNLLSRDMLEQAVEYGKKLSDDPRHLINELEINYGRVWGYKYGIFYYFYFKVGSEMLIG